MDHVAGVEGFEPAHGGVRVRCLTTWLHPYGSLSRTRTYDRSVNSRLLYQLSYQGIMERETRFELATLALARRCSTTELFPHINRCHCNTPIFSCQRPVKLLYKNSKRVFFCQEGFRFAEKILRESDAAKRRLLIKLKDFGRKCRALALANASRATTDRSRLPMYWMRQDHTSPRRSRPDL